MESARCHPAPLFTDLRSYDVGSRGAYDRRAISTLLECWRTAPYMHDGRFTTVRQLLHDGRHGATGGTLDSLTPQQIDDLAAYVMSL